MADLETASAGKFRYRRLRYSEEFEEAFGRSRGGGGGIRKRWRTRRWWFRMRMRKGSSSLSIGRRLKKLRIPSLRKLMRRKWRLVNAMRGSIAKVLKRFRDGEAYLGDLFAGNYLFLQVNPSSMKCMKNHHQQHGFDVRNFTQTYSLPNFI
ncbi:uncharacterized protein LOC107991631 [Cucumis melo]|uniref:Uncharacterized protein LOC107991631 n=1 Tax=Cucumis melo TaxID=3656 RepID=A0A1S4E272_CUCME|nr:uncharacterized protein LOC107991631 [Cucumis melo]